MFSAPTLHNLSAEFCFLLLDNDIRNQDLGTRYLEWILYLLLTLPALIPMCHGHQTSLPQLQNASPQVSPGACLQLDK